MAREHGVDLGEIHGSGESGLIMRRDVEAAISAPSLTEQDIKAETPAAQDSTDSRTGLGIASRTPVKGVRKAVAANMTRSRAEIPEATV